MKERAEEKPEDLWSHFFTSSLGVCGIQVRNVQYSTNRVVLKWVSDLQLVLQEQWLQFVL